jgi:hypothetical protein
MTQLNIPEVSNLITLAAYDHIMLAEVQLQLAELIMQLH